MSDTTRERILDACAAVIAREGLSGFRMNKVASEAGVSIGLLSYHFGDRDGLLQAALDRVTEGANRRAARGTPEHPAPAQHPLLRLEAQLCSEFGDEPGVREGSIAWNELRAAAAFDPASARAVTRSTRDWQRQIETLISESLNESRRDKSADRDPDPHPDLDPAQLALALTALVEGLSGRWLTGQISTKEAQSAVRRTLHSLGLSRAAADGDG